MTAELVLAAMQTRERFGISYWDAAILEAGRSLGCDVVLSEDLSDGADYAGLRVDNSFTVADSVQPPSSAGQRDPRGAAGLITTR